MREVLSIEEEGVPVLRVCHPWRDRGFVRGEDVEVEEVPSADDWSEWERRVWRDPGFRSRERTGRGCG